MPDDTPFTPEEVDEQIDRSSQSGVTLSPEQQLADALRVLYSAETAAMSQAIERGQERLAQSSPASRVPQQRPSRASNHAHAPQERRTTMKPHVKLFPQEQRQFYRLGSLVAAVLLVVLVGSLVGGLVLLRLGKTTTVVQTQPSLKGGAEIVLMASCDVPSKHCSSEQLKLLPEVSATLKGRIEDGLGISQTVVRQQGSDEIVVDLPPQVRTQDALALLAPVGKLEILDTGPTALTVGTTVAEGQYPVRFTGDQLDPTSIQAVIDQQSGRPMITFQFKGQAQTAFANYTQQNIGNYLTLTLDGKVIESAVIQSQITGQVEIIGGGYTLADAKETAALIRYGSVPVPLTIVSKQTITT